MTLPVRQKRPAEAVALDVSFAAKLAVNDALDAAAGATATTSDPALAVAVLSVADASVRVRVAGGAAGAAYVLAVRCPTRFGDEVLEMRVAVEVLAE